MPHHTSLPPLLTTGVNDPRIYTTVSDLASPFQPAIVLQLLQSSGRTQRRFRKRVEPRILVGPQALVSLPLLPSIRGAFVLVPIRRGPPSVRCRFSVRSSLLKRSSISFPHSTPCCSGTPLYPASPPYLAVILQGIWRQRLLESGLSSRGAVSSLVPRAPAAPHQVKSLALLWTEVQANALPCVHYLRFHVLCLWRSFQENCAVTTIPLHLEKEMLNPMQTLH